jgi:hypothetical protein
MTSSGVRFYAGFVIGKESGETMRSNRQIAEHEIDQRHPSDITTNFLWVVIPFTTPELTLAALRHAGVCTDLNVHVSLVDIQVVPFSCPMDQPPKPASLVILATKKRWWRTREQKLACALQTAGHRVMLLHQ